MSNFALKYSKYNIPFSFESKIGIFNCYTREVEFVTKNIYSSITKNDFSCLSHKLLYNLINKKIICNDDLVFNKLYHDRVKRISETDNENLTIILLTTTFCNANCYYCYQHSKNNKLEMSNMTIDIADKVIDYIKLNSKNKKVSLWFFGGEPLVNSACIDYICNKLTEIKFEYESYLITNGFLLDKHIDKLNGLLHIRNIQITIDDIGSKYDVIKKIRFKDAFNKIISNIDMLINNHIYTKIRINYHADDCSNVLRVIDYLYDRYNRNRYLKINCSAIMGDNEKDIDASTKRAQILLIYKKLFEYKYIHKLNDLGIKNQLVECMAYSKNDVVIDPMGYLYKCEHLLPHGNVEAYKNLRSIAVDNSKYEFWTDPTFSDVCKDCNLLPICLGGCKYKRHYYPMTDNCIPIKDAISSLLEMYYISKINK